MHVLHGLRRSKIAPAVYHVQVAALPDGDRSRVGPRRDLPWQERRISLREMPQALPFPGVRFAKTRAADLVLAHGQAKQRAAQSMARGKAGERVAGLALGSKDPERVVAGFRAIGKRLQDERGAGLRVETPGAVLAASGPVPAGQDGS